MKSNVFKSATKTNVFGKVILKSAYIIIGLVAIYYLVTRAFPYLIISEDVYGSYFFSRAVWIFPHVVGGILATLIGPFQFIPRIRNNCIRIHKLLGRIFLLSVMIAGLLSFYLTVTSNFNLPFRLGLGCLGFVWLSSAIMAYVSIRNKKVELHKEWMVRCYVITFSFTTFRLFLDLFNAVGIGTQEEISTFMSWLSWAIPLFITELIIQGRKI